MVLTAAPLLAQGIERERFAEPARADQPVYGPQAERNLKAAIARYERIVAYGGWPQVPKGRGLGPSSRGVRVKALRRRLLASGDLPRGVGVGEKFDSRVEEAVKRFQRRHGLKPSGRVYRSTLSALNVTAKQRLEQLRRNLKRVRALAGALKGKRFVVVNIPGYELQAISGNRVELYSRVITGRAGTPTPVMTARIRALDFYPYWNVPQSIAARALVPREARSPGYLAKERIRVFAGSGGEVNPARINWSGARAGRYMFRQDPGPFNALGLIRLDMPNKHTVYMHDTPLQQLFRYSMRTYSAGCVRVHRIFELAEWLLKENGGWNRQRVQRMIAAGKSATVKLTRPVPVHLVYVTAWGAPDGTAEFRPDVYDRDGTGRFTGRLEGRKQDILAITP